MSDALISFSGIAFRLQYGKKSFLANIGNLLPLGNREDFIRKDDAIFLKYNDFTLRRGKCYTMHGKDAIAHIALLDLASGYTKPQSGHVNVNCSVSSAIAHRRLLEGNNSLVNLLESNFFSNNLTILNTKQLVEKILIFSDLLSLANVKLKQLSIIEKVRFSTAVTLLTNSDVKVLDDLLFACHQSFLDKVFDCIALRQIEGEAFLLTAPSLAAVKRISDRTITCKLS